MNSRVHDDAVGALPGGRQPRRDDGREWQRDGDLIRETIQGKVVMVTGAAGSIGSEICRQLAGFGPLGLVGVDQAETPLFQLEQELARTFPGLAFHGELGNVTRWEDIRRVMECWQPAIVYHAAGYKHVPMLERHACVAAENNIVGTWRVAQAALGCGAECFVLISTDKAVRPASVMGATKRVAELATQSLAQGARATGARTRMIAVRFGNVFESSGSVVPLFRAQIAAGGPVTVTHPDMRRYFMTAPEASRLVMLASALGVGGEIFLPDMGEPVKIIELARSLIRLAGLAEDRDIRIEITGMRPGEKLAEELSLEAESPHAMSSSGMRRVAASGSVDTHKFEAWLQELEQALGKRDAQRVILLLREIVPDYTPSATALHSLQAREEGLPGAGTISSGSNVTVAM